MNSNLSEAKVLKALDIPDFRHLTKDKVVSFVSMLPQMDPEVARLALEQFPAFAETTREIVLCMKENLATLIGSNTENMAEFNARCQEALSSFEAQLSREDLSEEERKQVIDGIVGILTAMSQKDSENKEFLKDLFKGVLFLACFALLCASAPLGLKAVAHMPRV